MRKDACAVDILGWRKQGSLRLAGEVGPQHVIPRGSADMLGEIVHQRFAVAANVPDIDVVQVQRAIEDCDGRRVDSGTDGRSGRRRYRAKGGFFNWRKAGGRNFGLSVARRAGARART